MADELGYATRLLEHFVAEHFPHNPDWKPLPDLMGVLTQLDNAITIARDYKSRLAAIAANNQEAWVAALLNAPNPEKALAATPAVGPTQLPENGSPMTHPHELADHIERSILECEVCGRFYEIDDAEPNSCFICEKCFDIAANGECPNG